MKIGLLGTVSVGKTTLVKALAELPEFKDYFIATERSKYLRDLGIPLNTDSTAKGQTLFLAERVSELLKPDLLTDRTVIDVMAFTKLAKSIPLAQKKHFEKFAATFIPEYDYLFYISPEGIPIEDNGIRCIDPAYRLEIDEVIQEILWFYHSKFHEIRGSTEDRIKQIKEIIK